MDKESRKKNEKDVEKSNNKRNEEGEGGQQDHELITEGKIGNKNDRDGSATNGQSVEDQYYQQRKNCAGSQQFCRGITTGMESGSI
ncbi:hypothetical protein HAX54_000771 [Datura stramonium]|uniref:Uncharacterized protein n=1 Tax=Datura stramonium TaxID=4076 RepID=A0ABS8WUA1_DATST|nr:hypothetical protein [Datura stramonium]